LFILKCERSADRLTDKRLETSNMSGDPGGI
jgi:hypothetical protein